MADASPWSTFGGNFQGGLDKSLIDYYNQRVAGIKSSGSTFGPDYGMFGENFYVDDPTGQYRMVAQEGFSAPFTDEYGRQMVYDKNGNVRPYDPENQTAGFNVWDKQSQMGGAYDPSGNFRGGLNLKQEIDPMDLLGIGIVAAPFAAALGGLGATAASAGGAGGAGGAAGLSYTAAGAPVFGVVDTSIPFGTGISYAGGAPVFGVVDQGAAQVARQAMMAGGGAGYAGFGGGGGGGGVDLGTATGADMDAFYGGSSFGGGASLGSPSFMSSAVDLLMSGGMTPEFAMQALRSPGLLSQALGRSSLSGSTGYGMPIMRLLSGLYGRRKAKGLQGQMQGTIPDIEEVRRLMQLPDPRDITGIPGYQAGLEAVRRTMSSQGYQGSGNMMAALAKYGGDFYDKYVNQRLNSGNSQIDALRTRLGAINAQAGPVSGEMSSLALLSSGLGGLLGAFL